jgi:hypothetical protein
MQVSIVVLYYFYQYCTIEDRHRTIIGLLVVLVLVLLLLLA